MRNWSSHTEPGGGGEGKNADLLHPGQVDPTHSMHIAEDQQSAFPSPEKTLSSREQHPMVFAWETLFLLEFRKLRTKGES